MRRVRDQSHVLAGAYCLIVVAVNSTEILRFTRYLQLLLLEHVRSGSVEDVVGELSLAIYVDRCCGFTGQEAVVDLSGTLRELEETGGSGQNERQSSDDGGSIPHTHTV